MAAHKIFSVSFFGVGPLAGCTGVKFYSDDLGTVELTPNEVGIDTSGVVFVTYPVSDLISGTGVYATTTNKRFMARFTSAVELKAIRFLGMKTAPTVDIYYADATNAGSYQGSILGSWNTLGRPTVGGTGNVYYLQGGNPTAAVNFTVPLLPPIGNVAHGRPCDLVTGESVAITGGIPQAPCTIQWYGWEYSSAAWYPIPGANAADMPTSGSVAGRDVNVRKFSGWGIAPLPRGPVGNQFKLAVTIPAVGGTLITCGEKIWSVAEFLLVCGGNLNNYAAVGVPYTMHTYTTSSPIGFMYEGGDGTSPYTFSWSAPGATPSSGIGTSFTTTWSSLGTKTVNMTITNGTQTCNCSTLVYLLPPAITATITATPTTGMVGQNFVFSISGVSGGQNPGTYSYAWSGPDGLTGTGTSVSKVFSSTGTKTITCVITSGASTLTKTVNITITDAPITGTITVTPSPVTLGTAVTMTVNPSGGNGTYTYSWSGDETLTGTAVSITKTYSTIGTKNITCNVTSNGITTPITTTVVVESAPALTLSLSASHYIQLLNTDVVFTPTVNGGVGGYTYSWAGTDGKSGTGSTATFQWNTVGTKTVSLTVTSGTQNITKDVSVQIVTAFATNLGRLCFIS